MPSFQLDRGRFENMLLQLARSSGTDVLDGCSVRAIELGKATHITLTQRRHSAHGHRAMGGRRERAREPAQAAARPCASLGACGKCVVVPLQNPIEGGRLVRRSGMESARADAPPLAQHESPDGKRVLGLVHPAGFGKHERRHRGRLGAASVQSDQPLRARA